MQFLFWNFPQKKYPHMNPSQFAPQLPGALVLVQIQSAGTGIPTIDGTFPEGRAFLLFSP
jgi:hypothetical protein